LRLFLHARSELATAKAVAVKAADALDVAEKAKAEAEAELLKSSGLVPAEPSECPNTSAGTVWKTRPPKGDVLKALRIIHEAGGVDSMDRAQLTVLFYGKDTRQDRLRLSSRLRHWKERGWLVKQEFDWVVAPGLLDG
jgi:hypothetical protein